MRVSTDGGEMGDTLYWDVISATVSAVTSSPTPRSGVYCYKLVQGNVTKNISALSEIYVRVGVFFDSISANSRLPSLRFNSNVLGNVRVNATTNKLEAYINTTLVGTSTSSVTENTNWHLVEVWYKIVNSAAGRFVVKIDGNVEIDYTGDTQPGTDTTVNNVYIAAGSGVTISIDDFAINDTTGGVDDSWCGDGKIIALTPDGNGTTNNWSGSDGNSTDNYLLVDEVPNDGDTTYVFSSTSAQQDQYTISGYDGTGKSILRVYTEARARKTTADATTLKLGVLVSGGTDKLSDGQELTTSYARIVGSGYIVNPETSIAWSESDLDNIEIVIEVT